MKPDDRSSTRPLYGSTGLAIGPAAVESVRLAMAGLSNQEIANRRRCSIHTVNNQLKLFYDVARQAINDDAFWNAHGTPSKRRNALPLIWQRMIPHIRHLIGEDEAKHGTAHEPVSAALGSLPAPRCRTLWGREGFIEDTCRMLTARNGARIVLLAALGGYGKTECARAIAERLVVEEHFRAVAWVDLNSVVESDDSAGSLNLVTRTILSRLACVTESDLRGQLQQEPTLIVLDGMESVDGATRGRVAERLHRWLGNGPSRALITSRVDIVAPYLERPAFPGLDVRASVSMLRSEAEISLQATQLRDAPVSDIERICELTAGMPLALHQVVGQSQHYELQQVIAHLESARMHGTSDQFYAYLCQPAWRELSRTAKALLVYLAVATRTPQTARQLHDVELADDIVFDPFTLADALAELTTWFLVQRVLSHGTDDEPTYTLHPTTRGFVHSAEMRVQWAAELGLTERDLLDAATSRHVQIIDAAIGQPGGDVGRNMTLFSPTVSDRTLARSIPDMLHIVRTHLDLGNDERVLWYWEAITGYLWFFGRFQEFAAVDECALVAARRLARLDPEPNERLIGIIYAELGYAMMEFNEFDQAAQYLNNALGVFEELRDMPEKIRVLRYQATLQRRAGDFATAERLCHEALACLAEIDWDHRPGSADEQWIVTSPIHNLLGSIYLDQQRHRDARREVLIALGVARRVSGDHRYWSLSPLVNLGRFHEHAGRIDVARRYYERCLNSTNDGTNPDSRAEALVRLASLANTLNEAETAREHALEAVTLYEAMGKRADATRIQRAFGALLTD